VLSDRSDGGVSRDARGMSAGEIVRMRPGRRALRGAKNSFSGIQSYYKGTMNGLPQFNNHPPPAPNPPLPPALWTKSSPVHSGTLRGRVSG
jgi:hypothetical protein